MTRSRRPLWVAGCAALIAAAAARATLVVITVDGISMEPHCRHGERLLMLRRPVARLGRGRVVVLRGPFGAAGEEPAAEVRYAVKRLAALAGQPVPAGTAGAGTPVPRGLVAVLGDNAAHSSDSRDWGLLCADQIVGVVVGHLYRGGRPSAAGESAVLRLLGMP